MLVEIVQCQPIPAILFVHGLHDEAYAVKDVEALHAALIPYYERVHQPERLCLRIFEHLGHQLDKEAAKQSPALNQDLACLQQVVADVTVQGGRRALANNGVQNLIN